MSKITFKNIPIFYCFILLISLYPRDIFQVFRRFLNFFDAVCAKRRISIKTNKLPEAMR